MKTLKTNNVKFSFSRCIGGDLYISIQTPNWGRRKMENYLKNHLPSRALRRAIAARNAILGVDLTAITNNLRQKSFRMADWGPFGTYQMYIPYRG